MKFHALKMLKDDAIFWNDVVVVIIHLLDKVPYIY
jgi:hypothetical protein